MRKQNLEATLKKVDAQLLRWSMRGLSVLGKILVLKTFGISQTIYLMQNMILEDGDIKTLNAAMYKFLWNKKYLAAKAPERIRREIVNKPIELGGFGMLDLAELDNSIKIKTIGNLLTSNHPLLMMLRTKINLGDFYHPKLEKKLDNFVSKGLELIGADRRKSLLNQSLSMNSKVLMLLGKSKLKQWVKKGSRNSLTLFDFWLRGITTWRDLNDNDAERIKALIPDGDLKDKLLTLLPLVRRLNINLTEIDYRAYPIGGYPKELGKCSAREIRLCRSSKEQICNFKIGLTLTPTESKTWLSMLKAITSVKHRSTMLRVAHGEIYSKERMFRFRLTDDQHCDHCGETETIAHKLFNCERAANLWRELNRITDTTLTVIDPDTNAIARNLGAFLNTNKFVLTVNAELLTSLVGNHRGVPEPANFIKHMLKNLAKKELNLKTRREIANLLENNHQD